MRGGRPTTRVGRDPVGGRLLLCHPYLYGSDDRAERNPWAGSMPGIIPTSPHHLGPCGRESRDSHELGGQD